MATARTLTERLRDQADYLEHGGDHSGVPASVETDSDVWRESIKLLRDAATALTPHRYSKKETR